MTGLVIVQTVFAMVIPIALLIGGILWWRGRRRPTQPGAGAAAMYGPGAPMTWNVSITQPGQTFGGPLFGAQYGVFQLAGGMLSYIPDGASAPEWSIPAASLQVVTKSVFSLDGANVELRGQMGVLRCELSRERINRFMSNDFKTLRNPGYAREFAHAMRAHGAQHGAQLGR